MNSQRTWETRRAAAEELLKGAVAFVGVVCFDFGGTEIVVIYKTSDMKRTVLIAGSAALLAGGLAWYFFSRMQKDGRQNSTPNEHSNQVAGEKKFRRAMRKSKEHSIVQG